MPWNPAQRWPRALRALSPAPPWVQDYPEHRLQFFSLLHAITKHCFKTLFTMSPSQLKLVIDSIVWAFRHTEVRAQPPRPKPQSAWPTCLLVTRLSTHLSAQRSA